MGEDEHVVVESGATMTVKTADGTNVVVLLTSSTQVDEVEGGLKMRKKEMGMTALIPGLPVEVKGSANAQNQLAADSVKFKGSDLKTAQDMQASMASIKAQEAAQAAQLAQEQANLKQQQAALTAEQQKQAADEAKIAANKAAAAKPTSASANWVSTTRWEKWTSCSPTARSWSLLSTRPN
jgi:OOP family OmpA-OmpF porin